MGKKNKDPLADWTGPQIDKIGLESVLDSYFDGLHDQASPIAEVSRHTPPFIESSSPIAESNKIPNTRSNKPHIINNIEELTGSVTGSTKDTPERPDMPAFVRLDATHTTSESVLYSVMYRETHSKGISTRRFSIPELMSLSGIRSKNTVRRALAGLKEKLSIRELESAQANCAPLYEIKKIRQIFADRSAAGIKINDKKQVFHSDSQLTGSKIDPLTGSKIDPRPFKYIYKGTREDNPATPAVENSEERNHSENQINPFIKIFENVINRGLTDIECQRVISEMTVILQEWATAKSLHASEPIREVTYLLNGLRQALVPKQSVREIEPNKLRRWVIRLLKDKWPLAKQRAEVEIGEIAEYIKQCLADHRINYNPHSSLISATIGEWYKGAFDDKKAG